MPVWYAVEAALCEGFAWGEASAMRQTIATTSKLAENRETRIVIRHSF
jgi:hypothetical protein